MGSTLLSNWFCSVTSVWYSKIRGTVSFPLRPCSLAHDHDSEDNNSDTTCFSSLPLQLLLKVCRVFFSHSLPWVSRSLGTAACFQVALWYCSDQVSRKSGISACAKHYLKKASVFFLLNLVALMPPTCGTMIILELFVLWDLNLLNYSIWQVSHNNG